MKKLLKNKKGFTLVELIVVIAVLAVLMAIAVPSFIGYVQKANKANDDSVAAIIEKGIMLNFADGTFTFEGNATSGTIVVSNSNGQLAFEATGIATIASTDANAELITMVKDNSALQFYNPGITFTISSAGDEENSLEATDPRYPRISWAPTVVAD